MIINGFTAASSVRTPFAACIVRREIGVEYCLYGDTKAMSKDTASTPKELAGRQAEEVTASAELKPVTPPRSEDRAGEVGSSGKFLSPQPPKPEGAAKGKAGPSPQSTPRNSKVVVKKKTLEDGSVATTFGNGKTKVSKPNGVSVEVSFFPLPFPFLPFPSLPPHVPLFPLAHQSHRTKT